MTRAQGVAAAHPQAMLGGVYVYSSDGETTGFLIPHFAARPPSMVRVLPRSRNAEGERLVMVDHEWIHVVYETAPVVGEIHLYADWLAPPVE